MKEYPKSVSEKCTEKILEQMKNSFYKVYNKDGKSEIGIGFFSYIEIESKNVPIIIYNTHLKQSCMPHCELCPHVELCAGHCLGESYNKISKIKLLENKIKVFEDILKNKRNSAKMNKQSDKELTLEEKVARLERLADSYSAKKRTNEDISSDLSDSLKSIVEFKEIITRLSKMDVNKFVNTISNVSSIIQQDNTVDTNNISKEIKSLKDSSSKVLSSLDEMLNMVTQSAANIASITNILSKVRV